MHRAPTTAEQASYRRWVDGFVRGVGSAHLMVVLQPDAPFLLCTPKPAVVKSLLSYATRRLEALPHTSVYIEIGSYDWPAPGQGGVPKVMRMLTNTGIGYARGVALNTTHYSDPELEVARGTAVVQALARRGLPGKHFVVNTSGSGNPFPFGTYRGADARNPTICQSRRLTGTCVTLGIPPTADVADPRWRLSDRGRWRAAKFCDGFIWSGRPWLRYQNSPFVLGKALDLIRTTPYRDLL